jgi:alcohol dehydrogenase (cytochrome c)
MRRFAGIGAVLTLSVTVSVWGQAVAPNITFERILQADREPQNWLTYSGNVLGHRYSPLTQITRANVTRLEQAWIWQGLQFAWTRMGADPGSAEQKFEATPLVVNGQLYTVQAPNDVIALDATTGRIRWTYRHVITQRALDFCCGRVNRGLAILGDTLFMGTLDARLLAINASTGKVVWNTMVASVTDPVCKGSYCYSITHAPLVVKDKVIVGTAGGDGPIRGFIAAFDAATGKEAWRFHTIPAEGEPGNETWSGDSWKTGGAGVWTTGVYDRDLNLTYWGTGNPYPMSSGATRLGDNLYSNSVVALDADTGRLRWFYQFTPHDDQDWDAGQTPVLTDIEWRGRPRKVMLWANKNGLWYVLDRTTGGFLMGKPFVEVNWMKGFDERGRPQRVPAKDKEPVKPFGGTNWYPPSFSPRTGLFYVPSRLDGLAEFQARADSGAVQALDPRSGEVQWVFRPAKTAHPAGVLSTASDLLFAGTYRLGNAGAPHAITDPAQVADGEFFAVDARTGQLLWKKRLGGDIRNGPMSYSVNGRQYIAVAAGNSLFAFTLPR